MILPFISISTSNSCTFYAHVCTRILLSGIGKKEVINQGKEEKNEKNSIAFFSNNNQVPRYGDVTTDIINGKVNLFPTLVRLMLHEKSMYPFSLS